MSLNLDTVEVLDANRGDLEQRKFLQDASNNIAVRSILINSLIPTSYDYISLSYTGTNLTGVVYKVGGSAGTIVATLTLGYSGDTLVSVLKT
jgi:hypothetical protein